MHDREKKDSKASAAFMEHLKRSSRIVSTWPTWKQSVLGVRVQKQTHSAAKCDIQSIQKDHKSVKYNI